MKEKGYRVHGCNSCDALHSFSIEHCAFSPNNVRVNALAQSCINSFTSAGKFGVPSVRVTFVVSNKSTTGYVRDTKGD